MININHNDRLWITPALSRREKTPTGGDMDARIDIDELARLKDRLKLATDNLDRLELKRDIALKESEIRLRTRLNLY